MLRRLATVMAMGVIGGSLALVNPAHASQQEPEGEPYVHITYMCQADFTGFTTVFNGIDETVLTVEDGDHIWRIGDPRDADKWGDYDGSVEFETNFLDMSGTIAAGAFQFHLTQDGADGVNVTTSPDPNGYGGTASVSGKTCTEHIPQPDPVVSFDDTCDGVEVTLSSRLEAETSAIFSVFGNGDLVEDSIEKASVHEPTTLTVDATEVMVVEEKSGEQWTHTWTEPQDCEPGSGGSLPETSGLTTLPILLGGGALLVLLGGAALLFARRRNAIFR